MRAFSDTRGSSFSISFFCSSSLVSFSLTFCDFASQSSFPLLRTIFLHFLASLVLQLRRVSWNFFVRKIFALSRIFLCLLATSFRKLFILYIAFGSVNLVVPRWHRLKSYKTICHKFSTQVLDRISYRRILRGKS